MSASSIFIFGLGYVGQHLGISLQREGWRVAGTTRTDDNARKLEKLRFESVVWDGIQPFPSAILKEFRYILVTIPPDEQGDIVLKQVKFDSLNLDWLGYLSATSVYGDHDGAWVREDSSLKPTTLRGKQRLAAELEWLKIFKNNLAFPLHIFRLSGIYGPKRSVLDTLHKGLAQRIDKPGHAFSRIHVKDIISILRVSMAQSKPGEIYNLADNEPAPSADVIAYGSKLLGKDVPTLIPFEEANLSQEMREFYSESKRVANTKIKEQLGIKLEFPTYREGLKNC